MLHKVFGQICSKRWFPWQQKPPLTYDGELFSVVFDPILLILGGDKEMHNVSNEFKFWPDQTTDYGLSCT